MKLTAARERYGPALAELLSKAYHVGPTMPTLPKLFYLAESAVKNQGMKVDATSEAVWTKAYTCFSVLGESLFASRHPTQARQRKRKRENEFSRWKLAVKTCKNSPMPLLEEMYRAGLMSESIKEHFHLEEGPDSLPENRILITINICGQKNN